MSIWPTFLELRRFFRRYPSIYFLDQDDPKLLGALAHAILVASASRRTRAEALGDWNALRAGVTPLQLPAVLVHASRVIEPRRQAFLDRREEFLGCVGELIQRAGAEPAFAQRVGRADSFRVPEIREARRREEVLVVAYVGLQSSLIATGVSLHYTLDPAAAEALKPIGTALIAARAAGGVADPDPGDESGEEPGAVEPSIPQRRSAARFCGRVSRSAAGGTSGSGA